MPSAAQTVASNYRIVSELEGKRSCLIQGTAVAEENHKITSSVRWVPEPKFQPEICRILNEVLKARCDILYWKTDSSPFSW
jgi:hypothetical protein